jgi:heterodisulfide reductase subunit C
MPEWGYTINKNNQIDFDLKDLKIFELISCSEPSVKMCIACGTCAGTCSTGNFTQFSLRKIISLIARGEINNLSEELTKCMLCGKCSLVCPRGINTRNLILNARKILNELKIEIDQ